MFKVKKLITNHLKIISDAKIICDEEIYTAQEKYDESVSNNERFLENFKFKYRDIILNIAYDEGLPEGDLPEINFLEKHIEVNYYADHPNDHVFIEISYEKLEQEILKHEIEKCYDMKI